VRGLRRTTATGRWDGLWWPQAVVAAVVLVMVAFAPARNFMLSAVGFADTHFRTLVISGAETEECYHVGRLSPGATIGDAQVFTVGGVAAVAGTDIAVSTRSSVEVVWAAGDGTIIETGVLPPGKPILSPPARAALAVVFPTGTNFATGGGPTPYRWWQAAAPTVKLGSECWNAPLPDHV
jgi:hypothetical protein